jgi:hypothetical protein
MFAKIARKFFAPLFYSFILFTFILPQKTKGITVNEGTVWKWIGSSSGNGRDCKNWEIKGHFTKNQIGCTQQES